MNINNGAIQNRVNGSANVNGQSSVLSSVGEVANTYSPPFQTVRSPKMRKLLARFAIPILSVALLLLIAMFGGLFSSEPPAILPVARALDVRVLHAVSDSNYQVQRSYLGVIESRRNSRLSFEVSGKLNSVFFDEGQNVAQGDVLAELDTKILRSNRDVIRAQIESAQARLDELVAGARDEDIESARAQVRRWKSQLKLAQVTSKRLIRLKQSKAIARQEADDAIYNEQVVQAQLDLAASQLAELENGTRKEKIAAQRATVNQLNSELATVEINIEKSQLRAPYSGVISVRLLDEGEVVDSGHPVFELLDNHRLEARVGLPVSMVESATTAANHQLVYRKQKIQAKLKSVRPEKDSDTRTVDVVFEIQPSSTATSIGDIVRLELDDTVNETGFWLPTSALIETYRGLWGCYVAESLEASPNSVLRLRELEVLHYEGERAYVRGGLKQGENVVISGVHRLVPDQKVRVEMDSTAIASR